VAKNTRTLRVLVIPRDRAAYWACGAKGNVITRKTHAAAEKVAERAKAADRCPYYTRILDADLAQMEIAAGRAPQLP
jgi:hypothetical protein